MTTRSGYSKKQQQQPQQYGSYYILKWLTEEEFWNKGRHAFFKALRETNANANAYEQANSLKIHMPKKQASKKSHFTHDDSHFKKT